LPRLLPSLLRQDHGNLGLLVVDDGSTDRTAAVARSLGVRVLPAGPLPAGWVGKPYACAVGAGAAAGEWLLFCDADTELESWCVRSALAHALRHNLDSLSLFPRMRCETLWEQMLLPYAYQHFFAGVDATAVNDAGRREALLNGQFLLIKRQTYERVGGHAAVRASIVEDVALARVLKRAEVRHQMARGEQLVSVRMYAGLGAVMAGFAKNSVRFLTEDPRRGALALLSTLLAAAPAFHLLATIVRRPRALPLMRAGAAYGIAVAALVPWQRRFGAPARLALAQPVTALLFQAIALAGLWSAARRGQTRWKGRRY
jgi:cellulose synthase/poly-beta-1,6-N-acetylglucosamine synthase-like glycosyltransferase